MKKRRGSQCLFWILLVVIVAAAVLIFMKNNYLKFSPASLKDGVPTEVSSEKGGAISSLETEHALKVTRSFEGKQDDGTYLVTLHFEQSSLTYSLYAEETSPAEIVPNSFTFDGVDADKGFVKAEKNVLSVVLLSDFDSATLSYKIREDARDGFDGKVWSTDDLEETF